MNTRRLYCSVVSVDVPMYHFVSYQPSTVRNTGWTEQSIVPRSETQLTFISCRHNLKYAFGMPKKIMPRSPLKWKGPIPNSTLVLQVIFISYFFSSHGPRPTSTSPPLARAASPLSWAPSFPATRDASHQGCGRVGGAALALIVRTTQRRLSVLPFW